MTAAEIRKTLKSDFGIMAPKNSSLAELKALLAAQKPAIDATIDNSDPEHDSSSDLPDSLIDEQILKASTDLAVQPKPVLYSIYIHASEKDGNNGVFVGVNDRQITLPREQQIVVDESIYLTLKNARDLKVIVERDKETGGMIQRTIEAPKYNIDAERFIEEAA